MIQGKMVKRKGLKEGGPSLLMAASAGAWDPQAASCDGRWAAPSERRRKDIEKPENQAETASGGCCFKRRKMAAHPQEGCSLTPATLPGRWGTLGMLHPSAPAFLDGCCRWQRSLPRSHSEHSLGPLPHHRGLLSLGISWGTAERSAGGLALKESGLPWTASLKDVSHASKSVPGLSQEGCR